MCVSALSFSYVRNIVFFIHVKITLSRFEDDFPFFFPSFRKEMKECFELIDDLFWRWIFSRNWLTSEGKFNFFIDSSMSTFDHSFSHKGFFYKSLSIDTKKYRECELWSTWMETTEIIGKYFWQHWDNSSRCIYAGPTEKSFSIYFGFFRYIFCDVSDMNPEKCITSFILGDRYRIIEIFGVSSIYGKGIPTT